MIQPNLISFSLTEQELSEITAVIDKLKAQLLPKLKVLSPEERRELPKMGERTVNFVQKAHEYCLKNPELAPQFLDVTEFTVDVQAFENTRVMYQTLLQITEALYNTMVLSGSDAYSAARIFYTSTKHAKNLNVVKAGTICNDLSARFQGQGLKKAEPAPETAPATASVVEAKTA